MQAIEFETQPHNGMIKLPSQFQQWNDKPIRVILLIEEIDLTTQTSTDLASNTLLPLLEPSQTAKAINGAEMSDKLEDLGKLANLKEQSYIVGDPEDIVHIDWFQEWNPQCI